MRAVRTLLATAVLMAGVLAGASPAYAHVELVSSEPAHQGSVPEAPRQVTLTFSGAINPDLVTVKVTEGDGTSLDDGEPRVDGATVTQPVKPGTGPITVAYKVISVDGHALQGAVGFDIGPSPTSTAEAGSGERTVTRSWVWLLVGLGGLVLLGALVYVLVAGRRHSGEDRPDDAGDTRDE
ncbi:MAG: copper resistance CopC family protein [Micromonosporaceae bacterium]